MRFIPPFAPTTASTSVIRVGGGNTSYKIPEACIVAKLVDRAFVYLFWMAD